MSVISGIFGAEASKDAADTQAAAGDKATQATLEMFYTGREDTAPWRKAGEWAINALTGTPATPEQTIQGAPIYGQSGGGTSAGTPGIATGSGWGMEMQYDWESNSMKPVPVHYIAGDSIAGLMGGGQQEQQIIGQQQIIGYQPSTSKPATPGTPGLIVPDPGKNFTKSPGYEFRLKEGMNALDKSLVAKGRVGGTQLKAVTEYGQDYASNEYDKYLNQYYQSLNPYLSIAGMGQISAGNASNAAMVAGANISDNALYQGNARASGYINQANALKGASNTALEGYSAYKKYSTPSTGGGYDSSWADTADWSDWNLY